MVFGGETSEKETTWVTKAWMGGQYEKNRMRGVDWIYMALNRDWLRAVVSTVMNLRVQ